jgi:hypothetical protein
MARRTPIIFSEATLPHHPEATFGKGLFRSDEGSVRMKEGSRFSAPKLIMIKRRGGDSLLKVICWDGVIVFRC